MANLNIISYNTRGLRDHFKRRDIFRKLHQEKHDIIYLQETHSQQSDELRWKNEWGGRIIFAHGSNRSCGVAILLKRSLNLIIKEITIDQVEGRFIVLNVEYEGSNYTLCNLYGPNEDKAEFFQSVFSEVEKFPNDLRVTAGDFNLICDNGKDKRGGPPHAHVKAMEFLNNYMKEEDLIDIWRFCNPEEFRFTWKRQGVQTRLDFFLISNSLVDFVQKTNIKASFKSDHSRPTLTLAPLKTPRGNGYWKFNNLLLEQTEYVDKVNKLIEEEIQCEYNSTTLRWEMLKMKIRELSIFYSAEKRKAKNIELSALEKRQERLETELASADSAQHFQIQENLIKIKANIEEIEAEKTKACLIRSKANWVEFGEKSSAYFFALEKRNYNRKCISKLIMSNGEVSTDFKSILNEQKKFFEKLYAERKLDENGDNLSPLSYVQTLNQNQLQKVRNLDRLKLEEKISIHEIYDAIMSLQSGKTPGSDGFTPEFYRKFWSKIKFLLYEVIQTAVKEETLHTSARHSVILLLDKPNRDLLKLNNWRPLSMLTTDYKIFAKIIANRLTLVLPYLISEYQTGFIKERYIAQNITELLSIIEYCHQTQEDVLLISYDIYKAFDSVNWESLQTVLKQLNFGPYFCLLIRIIQTNITSVVSNNNHWTQSFKIRQGLRQGCPASPALYVILTQILSDKIMQNNKIKGVIINGIEKKLALYADDLWTPLLYDEESFREMLRELKEFEKFSGLKLNFDKTRVLRLGSIHGTNLKFYTQEPLVWTNDTIEILGFDIVNNLQDIMSKSLEKTVSKLKAVLQVWNNRDITPIGKIILFNTLGISLFVYKLMALPKPPPEFFARIKEIAVDFIWSKTNRKVRYSKLIQNYQAGGLKLCDLETKYYSLKAIWVKKALLANPNSFWYHLVHDSLPIKDSLIWQCNINPKDIQKYWHTGLWQDVWYAWAKYNFHEPKTITQILDQTIWLNSWIKQNKKLLLNQKLKDAKIIYVRDFYNEQQNRLYTYQEFIQIVGHKMDFVTYNGIIASIPIKWKNALNGNQLQLDQNYINSTQWIVRNSQITKKIYNVILPQDRADGTRLVWNADLKVNIDECAWEKLSFESPRITNCPKLRYFQYRLLHRRLTLNTTRSKWDQSVSPLCHFCGNKKETLLHLFVECTEVIKFWKAIFKWLKYICNCKIEWDDQIQEAILFNNRTGKNRWFLNTVLLIAKQYIYASKCLDKKLKVIEFTARLYQYQQAETLIALRTHKWKKYKKKWAPLL